MDRLLAGARAVVGMAGYNTVAEVLRARRPALLVPRTRPGEEQLVRARGVAELESYEMLHPDALSPGAMPDALSRVLELPPPNEPADAYEGADSAAARLADLGRRMRVVPMPVHAAHGRGAGSRHGPGGNSP